MSIKYPDSAVFRGVFHGVNHGIGFQVKSQKSRQSQASWSNPHTTRLIQIIANESTDDFCFPRRHKDAEKKSPLFDASLCRRVRKSSQLSCDRVDFFWRDLRKSVTLAFSACLKWFCTSHLGFQTGNFCLQARNFDFRTRNFCFRARNF